MSTITFKNFTMEKTIKNRVWDLLPVFVSLCSLWCSISTAQNSNEWPCFHGAGRTNKSAETGLLKEWPKTGPQLLWTITGLGEGYSSVIIAGGYLFTEGRTGDQTTAFCFDLNGKPVWKKTCGKAWNTSLSWASTYIGSRSTPTYDNGILYVLGEGGRLTALEAKTGKEIWSKELTEVFDAKIPDYGYSESVLIDNENLYIRPVGKKAYMACLNKKNGETIWSCNEINGREGYSSFIIKDFGGFHQIIGSSGDSYFGVEAKSGKLLWKMNFANPRDLNVADAISFNEFVFVSSGYGKGSMLFKLNPSGKGLTTEKIWESDLMDNHHGGVILQDGYLYGSGTNKRGWFCLDFLTGKQMWNTPNGKGSITYADGMLYFLDERGSMKLVRATPDKYECTGEFNVPKGGDSMYWAHPVVFGGRLYVRHGDKLFAYDIKAK
jgi:outer membrane protein assembly factor BamB